MAQVRYCDPGLAAAVSQATVSRAEVTYLPSHCVTAAHVSGYHHNRAALRLVGNATRSAYIRWFIDARFQMKARCFTYSIEP